MIRITSADHENSFTTPKQANIIGIICRLKNIFSSPDFRHGLARTAYIKRRSVANAKIKSTRKAKLAIAKPAMPSYGALHNKMTKKTSGSHKPKAAKMSTAQRM
ncbi:hypothetical protein [Xanthomonas oryzae]|uniref:hypothetical protein n=1 Tax=Xanthomonas oryzae TaxID=347 RepID=UPI001A9E328B|nr:hypothetical protein [Xanthomonas oryzae]